MDSVDAIFTIDWLRTFNALPSFHAVTNASKQFLYIYTTLDQVLAVFFKKILVAAYNTIIYYIILCTPFILILSDDKYFTVDSFAKLDISKCVLCIGSIAYFSLELIAHLFRDSINNWRKRGHNYSKVLSTTLDHSPLPLLNLLNFHLWRFTKRFLEVP